MRRSTGNTAVAAVLSVSDEDTDACRKERRDAGNGGDGAKPETSATANSKNRIDAKRMLMVGKRVSAAPCMRMPMDCNSVHGSDGV